MTINIYDDEFDVKDILKEAIDKGASDIFFVAGSPYAFKINGSIIKEGTERLTPDLCESIIKKIYAESNCADYEQFAKKGDDDFSISIGESDVFGLMPIANETRKQRFYGLSVLNYPIIKNSIFLRIS